MIPKRLQSGATIGVVSPSFPILEKEMPFFKAGVQFLEGLGFRVVFGEHVFSNDGLSAGSPIERAADIDAMFESDGVDAIICSQGGETANAVLPYINYSLIKKNPKIFMGISDPSCILNAIYHKTGLVTFHGPDVMWVLGREPSKFVVTEMYNRLAFDDKDLTPAKEFEVTRKGRGEGVLLGGNLESFTNMIGTPYFPSKDEQVILFIELYEAKPARVESVFYTLKQIGFFDRVKGAVIGHIDRYNNGAEGHESHEQIPVEEVLKKVTFEYNFPIVKTNTFGHNCENITFPIGVRVKLDAYAKTINQLDSSVE